MNIEKLEVIQLAGLVDDLVGGVTSARFREYVGGVLSAVTEAVEA